MGKPRLGIKTRNRGQISTIQGVVVSGKYFRCRKVLRTQKNKNYGSYIKPTKLDAIRRRTASSMATSIFHIFKKSSELPGHGRSTISVFRQMMGRILTGNQNSEWRNSGICQLIGSIENYGFHSMRLSQIGTGDLI